MTNCGEESRVVEGIGSNGGDYFFREARAAKGRFCKVKLDGIHSCIRIARMISRELSSCSVVATKLPMPKFMGKRRV